MDITKLLRLLSIILANGIVNVRCYNISPLSTSKDKWPRFDLSDQDDLHQTLVSIEERLKIVDSVRYGVNRLEISIDRINNRLDSVESRISRMHTQMEALESRGRMQSVMQMKLDSISQSIISAEMKFEMIPDQIMRKQVASLDRLQLRINSIEDNMESLFTRMQGTQNDITSKIQNELGSKTTHLVNTLEEVRLKTIQMEHRLNSTSKEHLHHLMNIESKVAKNEQVEMLTSRLDGIHNHLNQTDAWAQNDSPRINEHEKERMVNSLKGELHTEAQKFVSKVGNIYNDASKRLHAIENAVRDHIMETNGTQKEIKDKLRQIIRTNRDCDGPKRSLQLGFLDLKIEEIKQYMRSNFRNMEDKLDERNRKITNLQSTLLESCSTVQGLEELEQKVSTMLDKIHDTVNNKSSKIDKHTSDQYTLLKSLSSQSARTEKIIISLSHDVKNHTKHFHGAVTELFQQTDDILLAITQTRRDVERVLKRDISPSRRVSYVNNSTNTPKTEKHGGEEMEDGVNRIHTVEVHHPEGVIKVLTEESPIGNEGSLKTTTKPSTSDGSNMTTIVALPESLNATDDELKELLEWTPGNSFKEDDGDEGEEDDEEDDVDSTGDTTKKNLPDEFVSHILLTYIKLLRGQMPLTKFLEEANIARAYSSIAEMINDLQGMDTVPEDFIKELSEYEPDKEFDFEELRKPYDSYSTPDEHFDEQYETD
uniref:Coiled-coil domain-containing protein 39 n=3 Tax=Lygus hesperus TaxID=30085 RepID=A0A0A9WCH0_LYGHE